MLIPSSLWYNFFFSSITLSLLKTSPHGVKLTFRCTADNKKTTSDGICISYLEGVKVWVSQLVAGFLCGMVFLSKSTNQMEMNQCSSLGLIDESRPNHRCACTLCARQTNIQAVTHPELSDGLNGTERHISLATRWATQIAALAAHAECVTSKRIIHFNVWPLTFATHRSVPRPSITMGL